MALISKIAKASIWAKCWIKLGYFSLHHLVTLFLTLSLILQQVQRLLTIRDLKRSQQSLWIQWPILASLSLITTLVSQKLLLQKRTFTNELTQ